MPWKLLKARTTPIGIDLGSAVVKMAQLREVDGELELAAAASAEVPQSHGEDLNQRLERLGGVIRELLKSGGFKGRRCILSLPAAATFVRHVKTPRVSAGQLDRVLGEELRDRLPFPLDQAVISHVAVGDPRGERQGGQAGRQQEVIVIAASRRTVDAHVAMACASGLEVVALNVEPCAIVQCFARYFRRRGDDRRSTLFIDLGREVTQVVVAHGGRLVFARNLLLGARRLEQSAGASLGLDVEQVRRMRADLLQGPGVGGALEAVYEAMRETLEEMAGEISDCLHYYESVFPSRPVERAVFVGGQATDRRLCRLLARRLNLPGQVGDPLAQIGRGEAAGAGIGADRRGPQPAWAVAIGLSLAGTARAA